MRNAIASSILESQGGKNYDISFPSAVSLRCLRIMSEASVSIMAIDHVYNFRLPRLPFHRLAGVALDFVTSRRR